MRSQGSGLRIQGVGCRPGQQGFRLPPPSPPRGSPPAPRASKPVRVVHLVREFTFCARNFRWIHSVRSTCHAVSCRGLLHHSHRPTLVVIVHLDPLNATVHSTHHLWPGTSSWMVDIRLFVKRGFKLPWRKAGLLQSS